MTPNCKNIFSMFITVVVARISSAHSHQNYGVFKSKTPVGRMKWRASMRVDLDLFKWRVMTIDESSVDSLINHYRAGNFSPSDPSTKGSSACASRPTSSIPETGIPNRWLQKPSLAQKGWCLNTRCIPLCEVHPTYVVTV